MQQRVEQCQYHDDGCVTYYEEKIVVGKSCETNLRRKLNGESGYMPINIERAIGGNYTDIHICFKRDLCNYAFKPQSIVIFFFLCHCFHSVLLVCILMSFIEFL
ncbi:hypothetical protein M3Y97_00917400 [Aphelenchoides bicaudatus]|nr:hypothetical protein M3Y97_00917400 [Aphelenchoides bicaudatus]